MKSVTDLKWTLARRVVLSTIVVVLYVWKVAIPCLMILVVVHAEHLDYQAFYNFCMSVYLWMEGCRQRKSHVKLLVESFTKGAEKYSILSKIMVIGSHNVSQHVRRRDEQLIVFL